MLFAQPQRAQPIKTSLCELARNPQTFNHKLLEFRSEFVSRFEWEGFVDQTCSAAIELDAYGVYDDVRAQDGQTHAPLEPRHDNSYLAFRKYAARKFKWPDGGRCQDCPLDRITLTAIGRFDYFAGPADQAAANPAGDLPLLRFALLSVSNVTATPIDPSIYSAHKRRDLTLEEAYLLAKAFQIDHGDRDYELDRYRVKQYPEFQFFQALPDPPNSPIHYAIDLRDADVWYAPLCGKLASPSLKKLQSVIRNRIGLTPGEYRKLLRPGPFCDP